MRLGIVIGAATLVVPATAQAEAVYFHKPGVSRETFIADARECEELAGGVNMPSQVQPYQSNIYAAGASALFAGFFNARARRGLIDNVLRTCMLDKGYRRVQATAELRRTLAHLPEPERLDRLFAIAAAPMPDGKVLPR